MGISKAAICMQFGLLFSALFYANAVDPVVNTTLGSVRGVWLKTRGNADIAGFRGLPYAEPPIGDLRFENPRLWTKNWTVIRNATRDRSHCLQVVGEHVKGDEDCLYLNIFVPTIVEVKSQNVTEKKKLPVFVFIHGGAYNAGSSNSSLLAPTYLLDYGIILVTLNYRLNVLGFFSTGNSVAPGNYGLKDIATALRWLKNNIAAFGGDPDSVTLAGASSGAASAMILAASSTTKGLFHKLITMSGSPLAAWTFHSRENIRNESMRVAELLGCNNETDIDDDLGSGDGEINVITNITKTEIEIDKDIMKCLKKADPQKLVRLGLHGKWRGFPGCVFGPTLEAEAEGAILTVHPVQSLKEGLFRDMPWMTGVVTDEGLLKTTDLFLNTHMKQELIDNFRTYLIPYLLEMSSTFDNDTIITQILEKFYFNSSVENNIDNNITELVGDALITWASYDFLQKQIGHMKSNAYFYLFNYRGRYSNTFRPDFPLYLGTSHYDDINYLFPYLNTRFADLQISSNSELNDRTMINVMCEMWSNFVKTGTPRAHLIAEWEPYQKKHQYMRLGEKYQVGYSMQSSFLPERMAFWSMLMANHSAPIKEYRVATERQEEKPGGHGGAGKHEHTKKKNAARSYSVDKVLYIGVSMLWLWRTWLY